MTNDHTGSGFTILELLVTVGIIAGISVVLAQALFTTSKTNSKVEASKEVKQNGEYVLQVIERKIRNARAITTLCDGVARNQLDIANPDGTSTSIGCEQVGSSFKIHQITAGVTTFLTSDIVTLPSCNSSAIKFTCVTSSGLSKSVVTSFSLSKTTSTGVYDQASATFQTTISLRNQ